MSYADQVFRANCLDILQNGVRDDDLTVRPHWADGTPAHTIKKFGLVRSEERRVAKESRSRRSLYH